MNKYLNSLKEYKNVQYLDNFQEVLFNYFRSENYNTKCIIELSEIINIKPNILKSYLYSYALNKMNMDRVSFNKYIENERKKNEDLFLGKENIILLEDGIETKYLWNNEEEKLMFLKRIYYYSSKNDFSEKGTDLLAKK
ncbi:MAG: hypothetical protein J6O56_02770 [Bacilli bacterium]|nr:hypothetical protein [Bacilli bacterium]